MDQHVAGYRNLVQQYRAAGGGALAEAGPVVDDAQAGERRARRRASPRALPRRWP
ncbi:hypothetical protein P4114_23670 [Pseudomonas aeruginosa]|nr:hypothetical protein [Pseudomonas aeruginosa]